MPNPWHLPPRIVPNYGKAKKSVALRSNITQVLLHDNVSQQQILDWELGALATENQRITRLMDLQRKSFIVRQSVKQQQLRALGITHLSFLPEDVVHDAVGYLNHGKQGEKQSERQGERQGEKRGNRAGDNRGKSAHVAATRRKHEKVSDNRGKSAMVGDNREKSEKRASDVRGKFGKSVDIWTNSNTGHQDGARVSPSVAGRSLTFMPGAEGKAGDATKLPQLHEGSRSKTELAGDLKTFSTYDFHKQGVDNTDNADKDINKYTDKPTDAKSQSDAREGTKLEALLPRSGTSPRSRPRSRKKAGRSIPCRDPRFLALERSLVRTCWPVGGYTQLSPCGSQLLRDCGHPLFDYDALRGTIQHYSGMPTPRRQPREEAGGEAEGERGEGEGAPELILEESQDDDSDEE